MTYEQLESAFKTVFENVRLDFSLENVNDLSKLKIESTHSYFGTGGVIEKVYASSDFIAFTPDKVDAIKVDMLKALLRFTTTKAFKNNA